MNLTKRRAKWVIIWTARWSYRAANSRRSPLLVNTMMSYSSLTSRRIFSFWAIFDWKRSHQWPKYSWRADLFIHRLRNNVYYRWISSDLSCKWNRTANTRTPTVNPVAGVDFSHRKTSGARTPSENADLKFSASNEEGDGSNKQRSRESITPWISNAQ